MHSIVTFASCWAASTAASFIPTPRHDVKKLNLLRRSSKPIHQGLQSKLSVFTEDEVSKLTVPELKEQLRQINLPVGGRKQDLILRLNTYLSSSESSVAFADDNDDVDDSSSDGDVDTVPIGSNDAVNFKPGEELESMTVPMLKERLKIMGLPVGGRKQELIERLKEHTATKISDSDETADEANDVPLIDTEDDDEIEINNDQDIFDFDAKSNEDLKSRRSRRKKYFKTQEVRALIRANDPRAPQKAEEMIATLELMAKEENDETYLPGPKQYTTLIDAYAGSDTRSAEAVIERIMKSNLQLTTTMMNSIMGAYANMGTVQGAKEATAILERMEYTRDFGSGAIKPTVYSYSLAISAWAKCGTYDAATYAESILTRLLDAYEKVAADQSDCEYAEELKPNSVVFNSVIDAWANSGSSISGEKAEDLLNTMEVYSRMNDHHDIRPDTITFNTCIKAWCNSKHAESSSRAEKLLNKLETHPTYPKRNGLLIVRPNLLSYNTVINSLAQNPVPDSAPRAETLLTRMLKRYKEDAFSTVKPDVVTFSSVLNVLAKSKVQHKATKCLSILDAMIDLHEDDGSYDTTPNIICFNTILNACAFSAMAGDDEKKEALTTAVKTFKMLKENNYARPDALSYGNMLKCIANLMPIGDTRSLMATTIFTSCCEEGMVGGMALDEIRRCLPSKEFLQLLSRCGYGKPLRQHSNAMSVTLKSLPSKWTANVKRGDLVTRQRKTAAKNRQDVSRERAQSQRSIPVFRNPTFLVEPSWASGKDL